MKKISCKEFPKSVSYLYRIVHIHTNGHHTPVEGMSTFYQRPNKGWRGTAIPFFVESYSTVRMRIPVTPESGRYGANFVCVIERKFVPYKDSELPLKASLEWCRVISIHFVSIHFESFHVKSLHFVSSHIILLLQVL